MCHKKVRCEKKDWGDGVVLVGRSRNRENELAELLVSVGVEEEECV